MSLSYGFGVVESLDSMEEEAYGYSYRYGRDESRLDGEENSETHTPDYPETDATRRQASESRPYIGPGDCRRLDPSLPADIPEAEPVAD